ncbi:sigma-70 family RNA polymerase sigma factor [Pelosinus baikalensis]|uniref:Sigma-70 family RNA polymerase sigma factor n=1 Tax=Pelosinus baikalensis TaxID=2892015 RepID=A0ABS8HWP1_9FIRM|nr:sigma-70 family RNA polymerase sigma factor [Pelosinus baikalensis]MCC5467581.1 sigma-70 family RNA polymerase sigma factor [Pelosinus baikalensis]
MGELSDKVKKAQMGNEKYMLQILEKFNPLIKKYNRQLNYDGAESDLIIALIEIIKYIPVFKNINLQKDNCIVGYISISIKNKYIKLSKKYMDIVNNETSLDLNILSTSEEDQRLIDNRIYVLDLLDKLPNYQKRIINNIYIQNVSETDLAKELNISRQSVNRAKNRALNNLKKIAAKQMNNIS